MRFSGITFPARLRFTHAAGRAYRHDIEATWFGLPLLRVHESYLDGHARLELPFGVVANKPKVDQGANLARWGEELFWLPGCPEPHSKCWLSSPTGSRLLAQGSSLSVARAATVPWTRC